MCVLSEGWISAVRRTGVAQNSLSTPGTARGDLLLKVSSGHPCFLQDLNSFEEREGVELTQHRDGDFVIYPLPLANPFFGEAPWSYTCLPTEFSGSCTWVLDACAVIPRFQS